MRMNGQSSTKQKYDISIYVFFLSFRSLSRFVRLVFQLQRPTRASRTASYILQH